MPLVRIDVIQGRTAEELPQLADFIQEVLVQTFTTPELETVIRSSMSPGQG